MSFDQEPKAERRLVSDIALGDIVPNRDWKPSVYCLKEGNMRTLMPCAIAFGLLGVSLGFCQIAPPVKKSETAPPGPVGPIQIHRLFFELVTHSNPQQPFGFQSDLTDAEVAVVNKVATECESKLVPLSDGPVRWEALMRYVESGEEQGDWLSPRLAELKARRDRLVVEHVEALRASLGEPRFQALEAAIQNWYTSLTVTATGPAAAPAVKK